MSTFWRAAGLSSLQYLQASSVAMRNSTKQFHTLGRSIDEEVMSVKNMKEYLSSGSIKGVGPSTANKIVDALDESDLRTLFNSQSSPKGKNVKEQQQNEKKIIKKLMGYPGFGKKTVSTIVNGMLNGYDERQIILGLLAQGFSASQARMLHGRYGAKSLSIMTENPYLLVEDVQGFGFTTADKIAQKQGISANSEFRIASGILHTLSDGATADGHCCLNKEGLINKTLDLLQKSKREITLSNNAQQSEDAGSNNNGDTDDAVLKELGNEDIENVINSMLSKKRLRQIYLENNIGNNYVDNHLLNKTLIYHPKLYALEKTLAEKVVASNNNMSNEIAHRASSATEDGVYNKANNAYPSNLSEEQIQAIKMACDVRHSSSLLSIVTGGPGTGKTYVMREIVNSWQNDLKLNVMLASPTARAAQRLGEAAGDIYNGEAKTIHRLLDYNRRINRFLKNKKNPLEYDAIVIDEASMLDVHLVSTHIYIYIFKQIHTNIHILPPYQPALL
jgi:exodeoxyribonuclease V alpha subunit